MAEAERVFVRIPRETFYLCLIRKVVVELARRVGFSPASTAEIEMAVDEACSNAIRHGRRAPAHEHEGGGETAGADAERSAPERRPVTRAGACERGADSKPEPVNPERFTGSDPSLPNWIDVEARIDARGLAVTVVDGGGPFPFERSGTSDLDSYLAQVKQGGLGVYIMKHFMDEVRYRHRPEVGNELELVKYLVRTP